MKSSKLDIENSWILYGLLFLSCMNFMGRGPVIFFLFSIYGIFKSTYKSWNKALNPYLGISLGAIFASLLFYDLKEVLKTSLFFLSCYVGFVCYSSAIDKEKLIKRIFLSASGGCLCFLILTYHLNFIIIGLQEGSRMLVDFWTKDPELHATCLGLISSIIIIFSFYLIFCDKSLIYKVIGLLSVAFCLYFSMTTATRTPIVLFALMYALMMYLFFKDLKLNKKLLLVIILCISSFFLLENIISFYNESSLAARVEEDGMKTSRWDITLRYFEGMTNHLWGGGFIYHDVRRLAHNFIQEGYDRYGIFFFIPLMFSCLGIIKRDYQLYKRVNDSNINLILLGVSIGLFIQNLLEPTIVGFPQILWILFMTDGIIIAKLKSEKAYVEMI